VLLGAPDLPASSAFVPGRDEIPKRLSNSSKSLKMARATAGFFPHPDFNLPQGVWPALFAANREEGNTVGQAFGGAMTTFRPSSGAQRVTTRKWPSC
jgi:hypothetical protein